MAHAIEVAGLTKRFGPVLAVDDLSFTADEGRVVGFLGPERGGEDHHAADAARAREPDGGPRDRPRATVTWSWTIRCTRWARCSTAGCCTRAAAAATTCGRSAKAAGIADQRVDELLRARGAQRRRRPARGRLLARHAPAARPGGGAARRPEGAGARRARQRPGPAGHPLAARLPADARRRGPGGAGLQPRAGRGRPDRRRRGRDQQGPQRRAGAAERDHGRAAAAA